MTTKNIIAVVGVAAVIIGAFFFGFNFAPDKPTGGQRAGEQAFDDGVTLGKTAERIVHTSAVISFNDAVGENQAFWTNTLGRRVFVGNPLIELTSTSTETQLTASSTNKLFVATSSATTLSDFSEPFASIINGWEIPTSTGIGVGIHATSTTASQKLTNGFVMNWVPVEPGDSVVLINQSGAIGQTTLSTCGGVDLCVNATSSPLAGARVRLFFDIRY